MRVSRDTERRSPSSFFFSPQRTAPRSPRAAAAATSGSAGPDASEGSVVESGAIEAGDASVESHVKDAATARAMRTPPMARPPTRGSTPASMAPLGFAEGGGFSGDCGVGMAGEPTDLRCTGLYSDWDSKTVATDLTQYDPGLHLWSDGADKLRWIYLPPGQKIDTSDMDEWTFPVGTKVFKEFRIALGDASTETRIETRLLWKQAPGTWYRTTYRWTSDGVSDARPS